MPIHAMLEDLKRGAWAKTNPVSGQQGNSWEFRKDCLGNLVRFADYGNRHSPFGWELDTLSTHDPDTFQALHWRAIAARSEHIPAGLMSGSVVAA